MTKYQQAFVEFLRRLDPDSPSTEIAYKKIRLKLVKYFSWKRCFDPEDLADETVRRITDILQRVDLDTIDEPSNYVFGVARNVYREYVRGNIKREELVKILRELLPTVSNDREDCRKWCLQELAPEKAELIIRYYSGSEEREEQVRSGNLSLSGLRVQIHRIKQELRACNSNCLKKKGSAK